MRTCAPRSLNRAHPVSEGSPRMRVRGPDERDTRMSLPTGILPPPLWFDGDVPRARVTDPDTSHVAADGVQDRLSRLQSIVLSIVRFHGAMTDTELDDFYAASAADFPEWPAVRFDSPRKRRSDLTAMGLIRDSGEKRTNRFGSAEVVWVVA